MVKLGTVTVDGTKVRANASKRKAISHGRMLTEERRLEAEIAALLDRAGEVDAEEDAVHGTFPGTAKFRTGLRGARAGWR